MRKRNNRSLRLPNGFGSVVYLGDHRRRPYAAKTAVKNRYDDKGHPIRETLGYFEKYEDAYECLLQYNKNPYDIDAQKITFAEIYDSYINYRQNSPLGLSTQNKYCLKAAYKKLAPLHDLPIASIKAFHIQKIIDELVPVYGHSSLADMKKLCTMMFDYCVGNGICDINYAKNVTINKLDDNQKGVPFSRDELDLMWSKVDVVPNIDMVLIMCYCGYRASAYENLKVDMNELIFQGGVKTAAGKNRIVPIHYRIVPLVKRCLREGRLFGQQYHNIRKAFLEAIVACGIDPLEPPQAHTCHDCRATFATSLSSAMVPDLHIKRLMGHSSDDITKDKYITVTTAELRHSINKIP